jgi:hypothetical protein
MIDNDHNSDNHINVPLSQTYRSYFTFLHVSQVWLTKYLLEQEMFWTEGDNESSILVHTLR